jgi:hypothetical protein
MHSSVAIEGATSQRRFVMEQTGSEKLRLGRLVIDALGEIERLGYSRRSRNRYRATWEHLIAFARGKELGDVFSAELATSFQRSVESGTGRWMGRATVGVGTWCSP